MKIHVTRYPKAGSGIPLKLGFAPKRIGRPFACPLLGVKRTSALQSFMSAFDLGLLPCKLAFAGRKFPAVIASWRGPEPWSRQCDDVISSKELLDQPLLGRSRRTRSQRRRSSGFFAARRWRHSRILSSRSARA
jgi:hypothetical protein